jgi:hypothetical protein
MGVRGKPEDQAFDEWSAMRARRVYEAGIRLLAALGEEEEFPRDVAGVERLVGDTAEGRFGEVMSFAVESPDGLPRYSGEYKVWVSPGGDGSIRLRAEDFGLSATTGVLSPDGTFSDISQQRGFGVPDNQLTPQALADRETVERRRRERGAADAESAVRVEKEQRRFRVEYLRGVSAAPWQDPDGLVVVWVAFYETGLVLVHLRPHPSEEAHDPDEEWPGERLHAAAMPAMTVVDDLGNEYEEVGSPRVDLTRPLLRAQRSFTPAVPEDARRLLVRSDWGTVDVEVAS